MGTITVPPCFITNIKWNKAPRAWMFHECWFPCAGSANIGPPLGAIHSIALASQSLCWGLAQRRPGLQEWPQCGSTIREHVMGHGAKGKLQVFTECKLGAGYPLSLEPLPLDPESKCWTQAKHLAGIQGRCCDLEEGTLSITMLDGISDYHLHFRQRCLVTGYRQVQFSLNRDMARTYFLFLPWAEAALNNSVFIYFQIPSPFFFPCTAVFRVMWLLVSPCLLSKNQPTHPHLWLPVMSVLGKESQPYVPHDGIPCLKFRDRLQDGGCTQKPMGIFDLVPLKKKINHMLSFKIQRFPDLTTVG